MKCNHCSAEWKAPNSQPVNCPFCGASLVETGKEEIPREPHEVLRQLVQQFGKPLFDQSAGGRLEGLLSDFLAHDRKMQKLFRLAVKDRIPHDLLQCDASDKADQTIRINTLKLRFKEDNFLEGDIAGHVVDCLAYALGWTDSLLNTEQQYEKALELKEQGKEAEAFNLFRQPAEAGHAGAQAMLGDCYYYGWDVSKDYSQAVEWYRKAAEQGHAKAQKDLGNMYYWGEGVPKDYSKAVEWYRKAAEQGLAVAQKNLGVMYYYGEGVSQDYSKAVEWYRKAAEQGRAFAQHCLADMYYSGKGVSKDYSKAVEWYRKAAEQGRAFAQYDLGGMYYSGDGVPKDYSNAVEWYRKAAEQGYVPAKSKLEALKKSGKI